MVLLAVAGTAAGAVAWDTHAAHGGHGEGVQTVHYRVVI